MTMSEYVKKGISRTNGLAEVMERRQNEKITELETIKLDAMIAEEKKKLKAASPPTAEASQAPNFMAFLSSLFVGKSSAEITEILTYLTQEQIDKLIYKLYDLTPEEIEIIKNS